MTLVPRHPWTLGDNAPTKRLDNGLALIRVQRERRQEVAHRRAARPSVLTSEVVVDERAGRGGGEYVGPTTPLDVRGQRPDEAPG